MHKTVKQNKTITKQTPKPKCKNQYDLHEVWSPDFRNEIFCIHITVGTLGSYHNICALSLPCQQMVFVIIALQYDKLGLCEKNS